MQTNKHYIDFCSEPRYVFDEADFHLEPIKLVKTGGKDSQIEVAMSNIRCKKGNDRGECVIKLPKFRSFTGCIESKLKTKKIYNIVYNAKKEGSEEEKACYQFFKDFDAWKQKAIVKIIQEAKNNSKSVFSTGKRIEHAEKILSDPKKYIKLVLNYPCKKENGYKPDEDKDECIWIELNFDDANFCAKNFKKEIIPYKNLCADETNKKRGKGEYILMVKLNSIFVGEHGSEHLYLASCKPKSDKLYYNDAVEEYKDEDILGEFLIKPNEEEKPSACASSEVVIDDDEEGSIYN